MAFVWSFQRHHPGDSVVRRTKEEAFATRQRLLDAAELLFQAQGVSQTSLQQIVNQEEQENKSLKLRKTCHLLL